MKRHIRRRLIPALVGCGLVVAPAAAQLAGPQRVPAGETTRGVGSPLDAPASADRRGLRDPFRDPRRGKAAPPPAVRPGGLAGFPIDDVVLRGLVRADGVYIGILEADGGRSFFVRGGERLLDGTVESVGARGVVVRHGGDGASGRGTAARELRLTIGGMQEVEPR